MLQNPCKTLDFKKNMVYKIPPGRGGKPYPAGGLLVFYCFLRKKEQVTCLYTTHTNFITKYLVMCKVYTDEGGIKSLYHIYPPVQKMIRSLKLMDYPKIQTVNQWYNYYLTVCLMSCDCWCALVLTKARSFY